MRFVPPYETTPPVRSKWSKVVLMRLGVVLTLFLGMSAAPISPLAAQSKKLYFHHLNTRNGLLQSSCPFIYRDKSGYIWISSTEGLMRYDGQVVHHYHANPDDPLALFGKNVQSPFFEDEQGNLWFATSEAIHVYRKQTDDFEHFFIQKNNAKLTDVSYCILFYEPGQRLAVAINNEDVYWLYPSQSGKSGTAIAMPYAGKVWADRCYALPENSTGKVRTFYAFIRATSGIYGFGKYEVRGDSIYQTGHYFYGENKQPALSIKALTVDKSGIVWLSTNKGLVRFDISAGNWWYCNTLPEGNAIGSAQGHVPYGADKLWVSTDLGLGLFNRVVVV